MFHYTCQAFRRKFQSVVHVVMNVTKRVAATLQVAKDSRALRGTLSRWYAHIPRATNIYKICLGTCKGRPRRQPRLLRQRHWTKSLRHWCSTSVLAGAGEALLLASLPLHFLLFT